MGENDVHDYNHWKDDTNGLNVWTAIGTFRGHFNGNNHVIYGLYGKEGLFTVCMGGDIENVNLRNVYIFDAKNETAALWDMVEPTVLDA